MEFKNINTAIADVVFSWTGFNYDIHGEENGDGTENLRFDCKKDAKKFEELYNEVAREGIA